MKKPALLAISLLTTLTVIGAPLTAEASSVNNLHEGFQQKCNVIIANGKNFDEIKEQLNQSGINIEGIKWSNCPTTPNLKLSKPKAPKIKTPETKIPETKTPETKTPATKAPETGKESNVKSTFAEQVVKLVNKERTSRGLSSLTLDKNIGSAALVRAKETEISFSHTRPNGSSFSTALKEQGVNYTRAGENIAWGQKSPEEVMQGWMNSDGHRANILNAKFTKIGVGYYQNSKGTNYWTQLFTN